MPVQARRFSSTFRCIFAPGLTPANLPPPPGRSSTGFALRNSHELRRQAAKLARPFRPHPELDRRKGSRLRRRLVAPVRPDGRAGTQGKENHHVITSTQNPHRQPLGHDLAEHQRDKGTPGTPSTRAAATRTATRPGRKPTASASTTPDRWPSCSARPGPGSPSSMQADSKARKAREEAANGDE